MSRSSSPDSDPITIFLNRDAVDHTDPSNILGYYRGVSAEEMAESMFDTPARYATALEKDRRGIVDKLRNTEQEVLYLKEKEQDLQKQLATANRQLGITKQRLSRANEDAGPTKERLRRTNAKLQETKNALQKLPIIMGRERVLSGIRHLKIWLELGDDYSPQDWPINDNMRFVRAILSNDEITYLLDFLYINRFDAEFVRFLRQVSLVSHLSAWVGCLSIAGLCVYIPSLVEQVDLRNVSDFGREFGCRCIGARLADA